MRFYTFFSLLLFFTLKLYSQNNTKTVVYKGKDNDKYNNYLMSFTDLEVEQVKLKRVVYPKLAMQKQWTYNANIEVKFNSEKKIEQILPYITNENIQLFDTNAMSVIASLKDMKFENVKPNSIFHFYISYSNRYDFNENKIKFYVTILFYNKELYKLSGIEFYIGETNTFDPIYKDNTDDKEYLTTKSIKSRSTSYSDFVGSYGTCRFGFMVDTAGEISDVNLIHSVAPSVDKKALEDFKNLKGKWIPAREDGKLVNSYKEFDMSFDKFTYALDNSIYKIIPLHANEDFEKGKELFRNNKYEKALEKFKQSRNYYLDNLELIYDLAVTEIKLEKFEDACRDLEEVKRLSINIPFPNTVLESDVDELIKTYCSTE